MQATPTISFVIPTYNAAAYVQEAIASCLNQTTLPQEVIVVDDGSTDDTAALIQATYGDRVRYIYQANQGPGLARQHGLEAATSDYVAFCDADDLSLPERLASYQVFLHTEPAARFIHTAVHVVDAANGDRIDFDQPIPPPTDAFCDLLQRIVPGIWMSSVLVHRETALAVGGFRQAPNLFIGEDLVFYALMAQHHPLHYVDKPCIQYRYHDDSLSRQKRELLAESRLEMLQTLQRAVKWQHCMTPAEMNTRIAGRRHALAMNYWHSNKRTQARAQLRQAIKMDPGHSQMRRLYVALSYVFPASVVESAGVWLRRLRGR